MIWISVTCECDRCGAKEPAEVPLWELTAPGAREHDMIPDGWEQIRRGYGRIMCGACAAKERGQ